LAGKKVITPEESDELGRLYDELPEVSEAAAEALRAGSQSGRFRELDDRVSAIIVRINEILG
jgi:hypothetical protein